MPTETNDKIVELIEAVETNLPCPDLPQSMKMRQAIYKAIYGRLEIQFGQNGELKETTTGNSVKIEPMGDYPSDFINLVNACTEKH